MAKNLPKELFAYWVNEGEGDNEFIGVDETTEKACGGLAADEKRKIGHYRLIEQDTYTLKVTQVIKKVIK